MAPAARDYLIVTASYWGFTLVDGALRMLVLLHFFNSTALFFVIAKLPLDKIEIIPQWLHVWPNFVLSVSW